MTVEDTPSGVVGQEYAVKRHRDVSESGEADSGHLLQGASVQHHEAALIGLTGE